MARFYIRDETVHAAFDLLEKNISEAAVARAVRERREDEKKAAKAKAFLAASGPVAEREAKAILSPEYIAACESLYEAIERDEKCRLEQSKCTAIIEAWRTCQSNMRAMSKVA